MFLFYVTGNADFVYILAQGPEWKQKIILCIISR
jgi:hypothetical protein